MGGYVFKNPQRLDGREDVRQHFAADGKQLVPAGFGDLPDLFHTGFDLHSSTSKQKVLRLLPEERKNAPDRIQLLSRTNNADDYPRCHLGSQPTQGCALSEVPTYLRQLTYAHTSQNTRPMPLTAPSAVHLMICVSPDSQQRGLSMEEQLPLSPLQRFSIPYHCVECLSTPILQPFSGQRADRRRHHGCFMRSASVISRMTLHGLPAARL